MYDPTADLQQARETNDPWEFVLAVCRASQVERLGESVEREFDTALALVAANVKRQDERQGR